MRLNNKTFIVLNEDGEHEYDITVKDTNIGTEITLSLSHSHTWTESVRGEERISLLDDGNGISLSHNVKSIDYGEAFELMLLLNFNRNLDKQAVTSKYRVMEAIPLFEIQ
jgi:hypothetical protein